jgi:hypothetical protein
MATRRSFLAAAALATAAAPLGSALAQGGEQIEALFVQSATSMTYDKTSGKIVLRGVSPATIVFSDRPKRLAGHMDTKEFVPFWSEGKDSFAKDPPNATPVDLRREGAEPGRGNAPQPFSGRRHPHL